MPGVRHRASAFRLIFVCRSSILLRAHLRRQLGLAHLTFEDASHDVPCKRRCVVSAIDSDEVQNDDEPGWHVRNPEEHLEHHQQSKPANVQGKADDDVGVVNFWLIYACKDVYDASIESKLLLEQGTFGGCEVAALLGTSFTNGFV